LSKLYDDTKKSALFSFNAQRTSATEQFPALNRKFRIQKDRLITWGLAWRDDGEGEDGNIDDAVARADMTETVDSVLNNIKDISEEAARIQYASQPLGFGDSKVGELVKPATIDQGRYEDLLNQLTTAIDILYDLSRSRKAIARGEHPSFGSQATEKSFSGEKSGYGEKSFSWEKSGYVEKPFPYEKSGSFLKGAFGNRDQFTAPSFAESEITLVNPSFHRPALSPYAGLPPRLETTALRLPEEGPPPYEALGVPSTTRLVAHLIRSRASISVQNALASNAEEVPVLVEYANFDTIYRDTHVPPPLQRLEALASYLQPLRSESQSNISLIGYFEDSTQPRIGLVYDLPYSLQNRLRGTIEHAPQTLAPVSLLKAVQKANKTQAQSGDVAMPHLEYRFRLALRLVEQLHEMHSKELYHGNINSSSVIFATMAGETPLRPPHMRSALWTSFDIFSKESVEGIKRNFNLNIYRHPLDSPQGSERNIWADIQFDLYGLALVLLEVGLWTPIGDLYKAKYTLADFKLRLERLWIPRLASKCGSAYMKVVQACFRVADDNETSPATIESLYTYLFERLRLCCLLDEDEDPVDSIPSQSSFGMGATSSHGWPETKVERRTSPERNPINRHLTDPSEILRTTSTATMPSPASFRMTSASDFDAASVPTLYMNSYASMSPTGEPELPRQSSFHSQTTQIPIIAQIKDHVAETITSNPSFKEYKQKVMLIQQKWREHCASRCRQPSTEAKPGSEQLDRAINTEEPRRSGSMDQGSRPKRREFCHLPIPQKCLEDWECKFAYQLAKLGERALRGSAESSDIRLVMYGETEATAKPTILFGCERSTAKVKQILKRHFKYDPSIYDLRVKKCDPIRRCRRSKRYGDSAAYRSMAHVGGNPYDKAANPDYQERPLCGASIGAYRDDEHLPPVSFGGIVLVDGTAYGMSVHHMLEPDSDDEEEAELGAEEEENDSDSSSIRSSDSISIWSHSDDDSTVRPPSTAFLDADDGDQEHDGDVPGITPNDFEEIAITQPALDDAIDCDLHVDVDDDDDDEDSGIDEDHLLSYKLGQVHASSGLKRTTVSGQEGWKDISQKLPQEIDWALFELVPPRVHPYNIVKGASRYCKAAKRGDGYPVAIRQSSELKGAKVHCIGRTSGLASGAMSCTMELVKIHGRSTFSASWTVDGDFGVGGEQFYPQSSPSYHH
jgi:hypothetical protein